jgi:hypothetical protein
MSPRSGIEALLASIGGQADSEGAIRFSASELPGRTQSDRELCPPGDPDGD